MIRLSIISADFRPSFSPVIPPTKAPEIDPITKILAVKKQINIETIQHIIFFSYTVMCIIFVIMYDQVITKPRPFFACNSQIRCIGGVFYLWKNYGRHRKATSVSK